MLLSLSAKEMIKKSLEESMLVINRSKKAKQAAELQR